MVDAYVSFSNPSSVDVFPTFKSISTTTHEQDPFTIDKRDIEEIQNRMITKPIEETKKSKRNNVTTSGTTPTVQCDICSVPISGPIVHDSHTKGKKHQMQLAAVLTKNPGYKQPTYEELCLKKKESEVVNVDSEKSEITMTELNVPEKTVASTLISSKKLNCNMCNISCNSQQMFDNHIAGKRHQMKLKTNNPPNPAGTRGTPDTNPSSSNYCDVCSIQLNSENELTQHLTQKQHQTRVKEAEYCAKEGADMNINFDDYKILINEKDKDSFEYQCTICKKKFRNKMQLIEHLKSPLHARISDRSNDQKVLQEPNQATQKTKRESKMRNTRVPRVQNFSANYASNRSSGKPRSYSSQPYPRNRPFKPVDQTLTPLTSSSIFGAFDPSNQVTFPSDTDNTYYPTRKRPMQYEQNSNQYDGFQPKHARPYTDVNDNSQDLYTTDRNYYSSEADSNYQWNSTDYSSQVNSYNPPTTIPQPPWQYQAENQYDHQSYSNPPSTYVNPMHYPPSQPPLPPYEPPPLPNYPPPSTYARAPQSSTYHTSSGHNPYYSNSYGQ